MQHVTNGACALSARTYNAEVQGSDARLRNHFVLKNEAMFGLFFVAFQLPSSLTIAGVLRGKS